MGYFLTLQTDEHVRPLRTMAFCNSDGAVHWLGLETKTNNCGSAKEEWAFFQVALLGRAQKERGGGGGGGLSLAEFSSPGGLWVFTAICEGLLVIFAWQSCEP